MDWDGFQAWLAKNGASAELVASYRKGAERIVAAAGGAAVRPVHVDAALQQAEDAGASGKDLANLRKIGDVTLRYLKETAPAAPTFAPDPAPAPAAAPASTFRPTAAEAPSGRKPGGIAGVALSVAAALVGSYFGRGCVDGLMNRSEPVGAGFQSAHLGLAVDFPDGWKHVKGDDDSKTESGISFKSSSFFHGGSAKKPEHGLMLAILPLVGLLANAAHAPDAQLLAMGQGGLDGGARGFEKEGGTMKKGTCAVTQVGDHRAARCTAVGNKDGETYDISFTFLFAEKRAAMALFIVQQGHAGLVAEQGPILESLRL